MGKLSGLPIRVALHGCDRPRPHHPDRPPEEAVIQLIRRLVRRYGVCWRHRRIWHWVCRRCQQVRYQ